MLGNNSFPRSLGNLSREDYLTIVLIALVRQCKGEIHLPADAFENIDSGVRLTTDWDTQTQQLVLRTGSPSMMIFEVKAPKWNGQATTTVPPYQAAGASTNHRVMNEEQILEALTRRVKQEQMREWREQGARAVAQMPGPQAPDDG